MEIEKEISTINEKLDGMLQYLRTTDVKTNAEICKVLGISKPTLFKWYDQGCPREGNRHASLSRVMKHQRDQSTKKLQ
jgi:hypothetical protein